MDKQTMIEQLCEQTDRQMSKLFNRQWKVWIKISNQNYKVMNIGLFEQKSNKRTTYSRYW